MEKRLRLVLFILTVPALLGCNLQTKMLYYPETSIPSQESLAADNMQFWPSGRENYRGFVTREPESGGKGTFVVFHGNAGTAWDRIFYAQALAQLGYRVILAEYPAYGGRKGKPSEAAFVSDAKETLRIAFEQYGKPVFLLGESLGCGVAAAAAKDAPVPLEGLILITPWDKLLSVAKEKFPWLPVSLLLTDKYDSIANLKQFPKRIAVVGAEHDEVIPLPHALALYESLPKKKKMWIVKGAGHNDWPAFASPSWWQELTDFVGGQAGTEESAGVPR